MTLRAVFFDLDGTLLDTAPDLAKALNKLLAAKQRPQLKFDDVRRVVSNGANAMLELAFGTQPGDSDFDALRDALLSYYLEDLAGATQPFAGIDMLLTNIAEHGLAWGIVTNKPWPYTEPLMQQFEFASHPAAIVCPEHVKERKPAPDALYHACNAVGCHPDEAIYVGDHERDILCGINAGMPTVAVGYGYIASDDHHESWNATHTVMYAKDIWPIIQKYCEQKDQENTL